MLVVPFCDKSTMSYYVPCLSLSWPFLHFSFFLAFGFSFRIVDISPWRVIFAFRFWVVCNDNPSNKRAFRFRQLAPFKSISIEMAVVIPTASRTRDEWDEIPDEEIDETLLERLEGLTEAVPESLRNAVCTTASWTTSFVFGALSFTRSAAWVVATSSLIMFLPYIIEKERSDIEKTQMAQQRQMLLGPAASQMQKK